ncbi:Carbamoyl-phosphate synthase large chain [Actinosynnema sp. ALI-1.44]
MPRRGDRDAVEVEALYDGRDLFVGGVLERVDASTWALPPVTLGRADVRRVREATGAVAGAFGARGPVHVRFALVAGVPRVVETVAGVGRGVPFVCEVTGVPLVRAAARVALGAGIASLRAEGVLPSDGDGAPVAPVAVRVAGGVGGGGVGVGASFGEAFARARAVCDPLPTGGRVFVAVADRDRRAVVFPVKVLAGLGFEVVAPAPTAELLRRGGVPAAVGGPDGADLVVDTRDGARAGVTTVRGLAAAVLGIEAVVRGGLAVTAARSVRRPFR